MGQIISQSVKPFDNEEFKVAWLAFQGELVDNTIRTVASKNGLQSSKFLRTLYGDTILADLEQCSGDHVTREEFILIFALYYQGNTEDKISYLFSMYTTTYGGMDHHHEDGCIRKQDYDTLMEHIGNIHTMPQELANLSERPEFSNDNVLYCSQFLNYVKQYPQLVKFVATMLPGTMSTPNHTTEQTHSSQTMTIGIPEQSTIHESPDLFNVSPSFRSQDRRLHHASSFDFVGGDNSDDDSDDSEDNFTMDKESQDHSPNTNLKPSNTKEHTTYEAYHDFIPTMTKPIKINPTSSNTSTTTSHASKSPPPLAPTSATTTSHTCKKSMPKLNKLGKAVGGGISAMGGGITKVGHVILNGGSSTSTSNHTNTTTSNMNLNTTPSPYTRPTSTSTKEYTDTTSHSATTSANQYLLTNNSLMGYLHKISDGKWSKRVWHLRYFILNLNTGILSYYKYNPQLVIQSPHGSIRSTNTQRNTSHHTNENSLVDDEQHGDMDTTTLPTTTTRNTNSLYATNAQSSTHSSNKTKSSSKPHPYYRGCMDLNVSNVSLLFEKQFANNAPTRYFFQVSNLKIGEMENKRGIQYKLCARNEDEFVTWTSCIADMINKKHILTKLKQHQGGTRPLSHQQIYRQKQQIITRQPTMDGDHPDSTSASQTSQDTLTTASTTTNDPRHHTTTNSNDTSTSTPTITTSSRMTTTPATTSPRVSKSPQQQPQFQNTSLIKWHFEIKCSGIQQCILFLSLVHSWIYFTFQEMGIWHQLLYMGVSSLVFMYCARTSVPMTSSHTRHSSFKHGAFQKFSKGGFTRTNSTSACPHNPQYCCLHTNSNTNTSPIAASTTTTNSNTPSHTATNVNTTTNTSKKPLQMLTTLTPSNTTSTTSTTSNHTMSENNTYSTITGSNFMVRGKEYKKNKVKIPSETAVLSFHGADMMKTEYKMDSIMDYINIPTPLRMDKLFIINAQLPMYGPSLFGESTYDGPGVSVLLYWKIPKEIVEQLHDPRTPTLQLFARFLNSHEDASILDRFKIIAQVVNSKDCGLSGASKKLLQSHNGTPVLTRPQHRIYHYEQYTEIDIDVHTFSYLARKGIHTLIDKTANMVIDMCFVLQGENEHELPEQVIGCCRLTRLDISKAKHIDDIMTMV